MLKKYLSQSLLLNPDTVDGGGGTGAAAFQHDRAVPDAAKNATIDFSDVDSSEADTTLETETSLELNDGKPNKLESDVNNEAKELAKKGITKESTDFKDKAGEPEAIKVTPSKAKAKLGELPDLSINKKAATDGTTEGTDKAAAVALKPGERDYSVFPEQWRDSLKKVGNEAFALLSKEVPALQAKAAEADKLATELKQVYGGEVPKHLAQHPQAYTLSPRYQALATDARGLQFESNYYHQQLVNIKEGKPYTPLTGYGQNGKPIYGEAREATAQDEVAVAQALAALSSEYQKTQGQVNALQQGYAKNWDESIAYVNKIKDQQWKWHSNPNAPEQEKVREFLSAVPESFHSHPSTEIAALLYTSLAQAIERINTLEAGSIKAGKVLEEKALMDPTVKGGNGAATHGNTAADIRSKLRLPDKARYTPPAEFAMDDE